MIKIRQYCYFAVRSVTLPASDIAARLQMDADEVVVMGSRFPELGVPRLHAWKIVRRGTESVADQIEHLVSRLRPIQTQLVALMEETDASAVLQVVRYFDDPDGVTGPPGGTTSEVAAYWPQPLGWHLSLPVLEFLSSTHSELDVDEYHLSDDD